MPGMRHLADLECPQCERKFYGDLPAGHGLYYPMLIEQDTGTVHDKYNGSWFANSLRDSYVNRVESQVGFTVEDFRPLKQPVLLNCLDERYGHSLLKLLNAQYYLDHCPDLDLVVVIPRFLRWMIPDGAAAIWTVDLPLKRGREWNDWLAAEIKRRIEPVEWCWLSVAFPHPHPEEYDIERFTGVRPFPVEEWNVRLERQTVTFIWREDYWFEDWAWRDLYRNNRWRRLIRSLKFRLGRVERPIDGQKQQVITLAQTLRRDFPQLDFAVAGVGNPGGFPKWIDDLRTRQINEQIEIAWCERYAQSHVVIGVHGSNMLLPSAHAGTVVEFVPVERWGNLIQDMLITAQDVREAMYRYVFLSLDTSAMTASGIIASLLRCYSYVSLINFKQELCNHKVLQRDPWVILKRRRALATSSKDTN